MKPHLTLRALPTIAALLVVLLSPPPCAAATLSVRENVVIFEGPISSGDAERLIELQRRYFALEGFALSSIELSSPGGSVSEAFKISALIEAFRLRSSVSHDKVCASSCFFLYIAGTSRLARGTDIPSDSQYSVPMPGLVGLHRPYLASAGASAPDIATTGRAQRAVMNEVRTYLSERNIPQRLIDLMMTKSSREIYWLNYADLHEVGNVSAAYEELIIAKCGGTPDGVKAMHNSIDRGESLVASKRSWRATTDCESALITRLKGTEIPRLLDSMQTGWRPW